MMVSTSGFGPPVGRGYEVGKGQYLIIEDEDSMPSETKVTIPWSIPAAVSVKGIVHVPAHNTPMKPGGRETLLIAIAEQDPAHERGATRPPSQSRSPEELSAHLRDLPFLRDG